MSKTYSLKFLNGGSPFVMPEWTLKKHEELLEEMIPLDEQLKLKVIKQNDYDKKYRLNMMLLSLKQIDQKVTEKDLMELHPDDFIDLWVAVYNSGKKGIEVNDNLDFQNGKKIPLSK